MMKAIRLLMLAACVMLVGCSANYHSIYRYQPLDGVNLTSLDAKQRAVLTAPSKSSEGEVYSRFCAEPSPDVFAVMAQSFSGAANFGQSVDPKTLQAALSAAFGSAEQGSSIPRTQTTNMLREMMYRTCERYLCGGIGDAELSLQAARDQRLIVSILAIEQLTGIVTPQPVRIGAAASGNSGTTGAQAVIRLDAQFERLQEKTKTLKEEQKKYDEQNSDKQCESIAEKLGKDEELTEEEQKTHGDCEAALAELNKANEEVRTVQKHYDQLSKALDSGTTANTAAVLDAVAAMEMGANEKRSEETIKRVASAVEGIVAGTFDQDEFLFFCFKVFDKEVNNQLASNCLTYIQNKVALEQARNLLEKDNIEKARKEIQASTK